MQIYQKFRKTGRKKTSELVSKFGHHMPEYHGAVVLHGADLNEETPEVIVGKVAAHSVVDRAGSVQQVSKKCKICEAVHSTKQDLFSGSMHIAGYVQKVPKLDSICSVGP